MHTLDPLSPPESKPIGIHKADLVISMNTKPDFWIKRKAGRDHLADRYWSRRKRLLLANRVRLNTIRLLAVRPEQPSVGSAYCPVKCRDETPPVRDTRSRARQIRKREKPQGPAERSATRPSLANVRHWSARRANPRSFFVTSDPGGQADAGRGGSRLRRSFFLENCGWLPCPPPVPAGSHRLVGGLFPVLPQKV